ncbi:MAG: JAB domain-containing protein [Parasphingopyxis sp.]
MEGNGAILEDERACAAFVEPLLDWSGGECIIAIHLDGHGRVLGTSRASDPSPDRIELPVRQIVGDAIRHDACALILAHTHPGGDPTPSTGDVDATRTLDQALRPLGIRLYDHLIFTREGGRTSFRRLGWL